MQRRSSNEGSIHRRGSILGISSGLMRSLEASLPPAPKKPKPTKRHPGRRGSPMVKEPDAVVLELRRLYEQGGMNLAQIKTHMEAFGVSIDRERIRNLCNYTTRSHLVPEAGAAPYFPTQQEKPCTT